MFLSSFSNSILLNCYTASCSCIPYSHIEFNLVKSQPTQRPTQIISKCVRNIRSEVLNCLLFFNFFLSTGGHFVMVANGLSINNNIETIKSKWWYGLWQKNVPFLFASKRVDERGGGGEQTEQSKLKQYLMLTCAKHKVN